MYKERYKDINVHKIDLTLDGLTGKVLDVQAYGEQLDGTAVWVSLHVRGNVAISTHVATED
jgi:hypothetical protein